MSLIQASQKIQIYTWATRPGATVSNGKIIKISNVGYGGALFISNGTRWMPLGGQVVVGHSNTTVALTGTLTETILATVTIPGGLMSGNGQLEVKSLWSYTNVATNKEGRIRFGGIGGNQFMSFSFGTTDTAQGITIIRGNSLITQQMGAPNSSLTLGTSASGLSSGTQNTANDVDLVLTGKLNDVGNTLNLEGFTITYSEG